MILMKLGFAITAYDKFEEAKILFEILREEFQEYYPISFCSNHPKATEFAKTEQPEIFTEGFDYRFPQKELHPSTLNRITFKLRSTETVQKSCLGALSLDVDYILHVHADAWVLNEKKLRALLKEVKKRNKKFVIRGLGLSYMGNDTPLGHMDDHFFIFEKEFAIERRFFDFNVEEFWPHKLSVHGILITNLISKIGLSNIWYYRNEIDLTYWDGKKKISPKSPAKPSNYDNDFEFLHLHRQSFPLDYGKKIQALYLSEAGFNKSDYIKEFLDRYLMPKDQLINELNEIERKTNNQLKRRLFFLVNPDNRDFSDKKKILNNYQIRHSFKWLLQYVYLNMFPKARHLSLLPPQIYPKAITKFYKEDLDFHEIVGGERDWLSELETGYK